MSLPHEPHDDRTPEDSAQETQQDRPEMDEPAIDTEIDADVDAGEQTTKLPPPPLVTVGPLSEEPEEGTAQHPPAGEDLP